MADRINRLRLGFETAYVNGNLASDFEFQPKFISNNHLEGKKVLSTIEDELLRCDKFQISVAFITLGGITPLLQTLKTLEEKNISGEILTTNYLNFSEPMALKKLNDLNNIELKMYNVDDSDAGFHTKGYIFKKEEIYRIIIGSSNITSAALTKNHEWNTKLISTEQGEVAEEIVKEFNTLWNSKHSLAFDDFFEVYKERFQIIKKQRQIVKQELIPSFEKYKLEPIDENSDFRYLASEERVKHIIQQAEYFGHSGNRVKGLVFCSRNDEAAALSKEFNKHGYRSVALSGTNSQEEREIAVERLESDIGKNNLDYIFTVDIFNEGIDIPQINQVIMLRPTQSAIIFVQQLGRGLRKSEGKEYVVVLDFIGNYNNNFLIHIALSGDRSYNKDTVRKYVREGSRVIPGSSTIHFDEITKKRIFESIDKMSTTKRMLTEKYYQVKYKLGRIPTITDFYELGEIDPMLFIEYSKTYDNFLRNVDKEYSVKFSAKEEQILAFVSSLIINGKRPHELLMLQMLLQEKEINEKSFKIELENIGESFKRSDYISSNNMLKMDFISGNDLKKFSDIELLTVDENNKGLLKRSISFTGKLNRAEFRKELNNLIQYGLLKYHNAYSNHDDNNMVLYRKYSRKDVCRLLNWDKDESSTVYGYRIKHNTCPIFVTYEKNDDISDSTKYEDKFINNSTFSWMTRNNVTLQSKECTEIINYQKSELKICLFIKKSDGEGTDFYYMGEVEPTHWRQTTIQNDKGKILPIVNFIFRLKNTVREDIYEYLAK